MRISIILAHPDAKSLNHAIADTAQETLSELGHDVILHDLYAEGFDPILPAGEIPRDAELPPVIAQHCDEIARAEGIIIVHPNWWGQPPAVLKGWVDRVIRPGVAYAFIEGDEGDGVPVALLQARTAVVLNTSNTPTEREQQVFGDPLEHIWADCILELCGVADVRRRMFNVVVTSTSHQRAMWLDEVRQMVRDAFA